MTDVRYQPPVLMDFACRALAARGLTPEMAQAVAGALLEADLLGHHTHGLILLGDYLEEIENGDMIVTGEPTVLADHAAVATWDARRLPGLWTTSRAISEATRRAEKFGMGAIALRRSHHIGCLASFLEAPARQGYVVLIFSSDPSDAHVAPYGAVTPVLTPNPIAAGIPAEPDPVLIDVSTSITTAAMCGRAKRNGTPLPGRWLLGPDGKATDNASGFGQGATILPIGGVDHGHKGYALSFLVEALSQGLSGFGRHDEPRQWGAAVLVLALAPAAFGPAQDFLAQSSFLADACRAAKPVPGGKPVRLPGEAGLERKRRALAGGLALPPHIVSALTDVAGKLKLAPPQAR
jgi:L-lactate dehydrogenase